MYQRADISKTKLIFQCTEGSKQVLLNVSAIWTIPQSIRFQIDFLPLLQLFKYGKKINPNCFRWVIHHFNNNFFVSRLLQLSEECVFENLPGAFKLLDVHYSSLPEATAKQEQSAPAYFTSSLLFFSSMCNMTSSSWFPYFEHQSRSNMVLSGILNQVFSKPSLKVHSDTFPISNTFQVSASWFSYCTDKNWIQ